MCNGKTGYAPSVDGLLGSGIMLHNVNHTTRENVIVVTSADRLSTGVMKNDFQ